MKSTLREIITILTLLLVATAVSAQQSDGGKEYFMPVITSVPSLSITPDARAGGMGDVGAATYPDINAQHWNPAKYAFNDSRAGVSLSYTPWLRKLVNDINLIYLAGFYKLGNSDLQALSASLRYFSLGEVAITDDNGTPINSIHPYEMAVDLGYSRKLSENFSGAVALRYILSDFRTDSEGAVGNAFAADVAGYYQKYLFVGRNECLLSLGFNISNIGTKISYDHGNTSFFIPTNMRLGGSFSFPMDDYNFLSLSLDLNRLLVPSRPVNTTGDPDDPDYLKKLDDYYNMSSITGIFKSFGDTPDGFSGELKKINLSIGAEYDYNHQFFARLGYHYEHPMMGNRQFFTFGAGFKLNIFSLDAAYLVSTAQSNPLDQTLRFSLSFDLDGIKSILER